MCFSNPKAVAVLWQRFVRHLREAFWDTGCLLPRMDPPTSLPPSPLGRPEAPPSTGGGDQDMSASGLPRPDFSCCLLHQKLQMLNLCIHQAHQLQAHHTPQPGMVKVGTCAPVNLVCLFDCLSGCVSIACRLSVKAGQIADEVHMGSEEDVSRAGCGCLPVSLSLSLC